MYFESLSAAIAMDGHGGYVLSAYIITIVVIAVVFIWPRRAEKQFFSELQGEIKRRERGQD